MDMLKTGSFIRASRIKAGLSQHDLGKYLSVTDKAVSKWERGIACPDIDNLKNMALLFRCGITDILNGEVAPTDVQCAVPAEIISTEPEKDTNAPEDDVTVIFDLSCQKSISPLLFGDNLEHTRACVNGGLSAEILKNRKFVGKPGRYGCAYDWYPIGEKPFLMLKTDEGYLADGKPYTRHAEGYSMRRSLERNAQYITNYYSSQVGMGQKELYFRAECQYTFEIAVMATEETELTVYLKSGDNSIIDSGSFIANSGDYEEISLTLYSKKEENDGRIEIVFTSPATVMIGAVSLMPSDNFHGMRRDVIESMKELGIRLLRWPGGNFSGEYNWKDGLLPRNMRSPLRAYQWLEEQPHTLGFDFHEINTDDFIALCREIGAEPYITINPAWNTPEESRQWVEYCNGDDKTEYGKLRSLRGHPEPYNVQFWSLGNEAGYGHMEGANTPDAYARVVREHAAKMLEVSPWLTLCSCGPYPSGEWFEHSAKKLKDVANVVSLHHYTPFPQYIDPSKTKEEYEAFVSEAYKGNLYCMRDLGNLLKGSGIRISYDEWNAWYSWYRTGSVSEGIFVASFMNMLFMNADKYGVTMACHFESVNEGSIMVYPDRVKLAPAGQAFSLLKSHAGGIICSLRQDVIATRSNDAIICTLINRSYDKEKNFTLNGVSELISCVMYSSLSVYPTSEFVISDLPAAIQDGSAKTILPPHSIAQIMLKTI